MEQDHRGIKQRYYPTLGYKCMAAAGRFCRAFDEVRNYFRLRSVMGEEWPWSQRRENIREPVLAVARSVLPNMK
jgi:putative transposase